MADLFSAAFCAMKLISINKGLPADGADIGAVSALVGAGALALEKAVVDRFFGVGLTEALADKEDDEAVVRAAALGADIKTPF